MESTSGVAALRLLGGYTARMNRVERIVVALPLGLAVVGAGLLLIFASPPVGLIVAAIGIAVVEWAIRRRALWSPPFPKRRPEPPPDGAGTRTDEAEPFDLSRPRDLLTLAFIGVGFAFVLGVYIVGPALHPIHLTVPVALALVYLRVRRALSRDG